MASTFTDPYAGSALDRQAVLIVGDGPTAIRCSHTLITEGRGRFRLAGVIPSAELPRTLDPEGLRKLLPSVRAGEEPLPIPKRIVIALEDRRVSLPLDQLVKLRFRGVAVQDAHSFLEEMTEKISVRTIRPGDLLYAGGFQFSRPKILTKIAMEWVAGAVLLLLTAPVIGLAALAIQIESGRPIFFRQQRVGLGGKLFTIYKLRTMVKDAEKSGPQFARANDDRITPVGHWLRRLRIDELPQLINVFRGEMALVGPRPERPVFVESFRELSPYFTLRHSVRPGVTGWAQVCLGYTDSGDSTLEKLSYDLFYIKHFSWMLDIRILLKTVKTVLGLEGR